MAKPRNQHSIQIVRLTNRRVTGTTLTILSKVITFHKQTNSMLVLPMSSEFLDEAVAMHSVRQLFSLAYANAQIFDAHNGYSFNK